MEFVGFFLVFIYVFAVQLSSSVKLIYLLLPSTSRFVLINDFLSFAMSVIERQNKTKEGVNPK